MHSLFNRQYNTWEDLENTIECIESTKEKGDAFEEFVWFYFDYHKAFYQLKEVYSQAIPNRGIPEVLLNALKLEKKDHGVDGVAILSSGELFAYQAKFRTARVAPTATELATFWAEAERANYRCVVANSFELPVYSQKIQNHLAVLGDKFLELDAAFWKSLFLFATKNEVPTLGPKHSPRPYQEEILEKIVDGFKNSDRGKLIAACGIGKTLLALWVSERISTQTVLFLAPSLGLIRQTLKEWVGQAETPFSYLCVCSDKTVDSDIQNDLPVFLEGDIDVPVSTDSTDILKFLNKESGNKKVIFSTYQSLDAIAAAVQAVGDFRFDLTIFDEAHRTAGVSESGLFSLALDDAKIPSGKRLFMTATERMVKPWIKSKVEEAKRVVFSMDDQKTYGTTFYKLPFGFAIEKNIIADYRIVLAGITQKELTDLVASNRYVAIEELQTGRSGDLSLVLSAQTAFKLLLLLKSVAELNIQKVITFHSSVKSAQQIIQGARASRPVFEMIGIDANQSIFLDHVNGSIPASGRAGIINNFEKSELGILSNVRCLSEGVDIPLIDSVFFADAKESPIDIVQAVGRALRQPYGKVGKLAYIIIPVILSDAENEEGIVGNSNFDSLYSVIQALRDQDDTLSEWIDQLNLSAVTGRTSRVPRSSGKLIINLPKQIDLDSFYDFISVKIAEVNKNPTGTTGIGSTLGRTERVSSFTRVFKTFGDYNVIPYKESCVDPTLEFFSDSDAVRTRSEIKIDHNNVSHTERLGLIYQITKNNFGLTSLGCKYRFEGRSFTDIFRNQMLLYSIKTDDTTLFPYRAALEILKSVSSMNIIEFLYGLYSIQASEDLSASIEEVADRIFWIRSELPNVHLTSQANQETVLLTLNSNHPVGFSSKDVWTDRTTVANQYRYFTNHMSLFYEAFQLNGSGYSAMLQVTEQGAELIDGLLECSRPDDFDFEGRYGEWIWVDKFADTISNIKDRC